MNQKTYSIIKNKNHHIAEYGDSTDRKDNERIRTGLSIVFSIILALTVLGLIFSSVVSLTVFNINYLEYAVLKSKYVDRAYDDLITLLADESDEHDLPGELLASSVDEDRFSDDLNMNIRLASNGQESSGDGGSTALADTVRAELTDYLEDNQVGNNQWVEMATDEMVDISTGYYLNYSNFPFGKKISEYKDSISQPVYISTAVFLALSIVLTVVIYKLHSDTYSRWLHIQNSLLAAGLISIVLGFAIQYRMNYAFTETLMGYESFINTYFDHIGAIFIICGIALIIMTIMGVLLLRAGRNRKVIK